jgi:hypothetical protein
VLSLVDSVDLQLETLGNLNMDKKERIHLYQMRAMSAWLRQQGAALQTYWKTAQDQDAGRYDSLRTNSYAAIRKLMGIGP